MFLAFLSTQLFAMHELLRPGDWLNSSSFSDWRRYNAELFFGKLISGYEGACGQGRCADSLRHVRGFDFRQSREGGCGEWSVPPCGIKAKGRFTPLPLAASRAVKIGRARQSSARRRRSHQTPARTE